jgi:hypothetical protein
VQARRDGDVAVFASVAQNAGDGIAGIIGMGHGLAIRGVNLGASAYRAPIPRLWALFGFHNSSHNSRQARATSVQHCSLADSGGLAVSLSLAEISSPQDARLAAGASCELRSKKQCADNKGERAQLSVQYCSLADCERRPDVVSGVQT